MSTALERRLEQVQDVGLTARERARLVVRCWLRDEQWDERLVKYMPPEQKPEYDRLCRAIEDANHEVWQAVTFWCEWLWQTELAMGWWQSLSAYQEREAVLLGNQRKRTKALPALPPLKLGMERDLPSLWGVKSGEDAPIPESWDAVRERLAADLRQAIELRWTELVAVEEMLERLARAWGEEAVALRVREAMAACRAKVMELHAAHQAMAGAWELPEPTDRRRAVPATWVRWEDIEETSATTGRTYDPRRSLYGAQRAELAEQEAVWAASVRG